MSAGQHEALTVLARSSTSAHRGVQRAKVLLMAADGVANSQIAAKVGVSPVTVRSWRGRFASEGLANFGQVRQGRGRKPVISAEKIEEIVRLTQHEKPSGAMHWSCRSMAKAAGISPATVQRIWSGRGLKPHLVKTFKVSNDPAFEEKLIDVVGLYLNPPENAVVLCMDEKTSVQAFDRTQASLPMKRSRAPAMTSDDKRHGTTTLFAALNALDGTVIGSRMDRHRRGEFLRFIRTVDKAVPKGPCGSYDSGQLRHP
jgi:transposase